MSSCGSRTRLPKPLSTADVWGQVTCGSVCPAHPRMLSSVPGLNPLDVSTPSPSGDNQKHLQTGPQAPQGRNHYKLRPLLRGLCPNLCPPPQMSKYMTLPTPPSDFYFTSYYACMHTKSLQSCPTLCNSTDCSPPAPLSMGFSRQEYWSGLPCPSPTS